MNNIKKAYCRTFQAAFKLALPVMPYRNPKIVPSVDALPAVFHREKCGKVLIITDAGIMKLGLTQQLEHALQVRHFPYVIFDKTEPNPTTDNVEEALQLYIAEGCDCIVGFGGGSSMDCAKAVGARAVKPRQSLAKMKGILRVLHRLPLLVCVPTTAGTGSETTLAAVIVDSKTRHKYVINDFSLIPRYAVLDPRVTLSLPPFLTATTGMDALTHAVEAYIGNTTTKQTREQSEQAVRLIFENLKTAVEDGQNLTARENMLHASYYAGCAFTKSYVGYVHAVAHSLGGQYNVPHGLANAILLPFVLEAYGSSIEGKLAKLATISGIVEPGTAPAEAAEAFLAAICRMKVDFGIGDTVPQLKEEDIPALSRYADQEGNPLYPVPVLMDAEELQQFYRRVLVSIQEEEA